MSLPQVVHAVHESAFCVALKKPGLQVLHAWFVVEVPEVLTCSPGTHAVYVVQLVAFEVVLNEPLAQGAQVRFVVVLPGEAIEVPAAQSAQGTHAVEALASASHVPLAQGTAGSSPPAQKLPAEQSEQTVLVVAVPGVLTAYPALHGVHAAQTVVVFAS